MCVKIQILAHANNWSIPTVPLIHPPVPLLLHHTRLFTAPQPIRLCNLHSSRHFCGENAPSTCCQPPINPTKWAKQKKLSKTKWYNNCLVMKNVIDQFLSVLLICLCSPSRLKNLFWIYSFKILVPWSHRILRLIYLFVLDCPVSDNTSVEEFGMVMVDVSAVWYHYLDREDTKQTNNCSLFSTGRAVFVNASLFSFISPWNHTTHIGRYVCSSWISLGL